MHPLPQQSVLFEMLRSFTTLARTLNLSKTVETLGVTRQTVRRHVNGLEALKGVKFFEIEDRRYGLTAAGMKSAQEAEEVLARADTWLNGQHQNADYVAGMAHQEYSDRAGTTYIAQQHALDRLWVDGPPLLKKGFLAWANSRFQIESPLMDELKPYLLVYRKHREYWVCVNCGEKSSFATWFGWAWGKSSLGRLLEETIGESDQSRIIARTYSEVLLTKSARIDHVFTRISREVGGPEEPVRYQRLLCGCIFPDGEPALMVLVARTNRIQIPCLNLDELPLMREDLAMEFDI